MKIISWALAAALGACLNGCGPVWSAVVVADANGKYKAAEAMDAKTHAPYEYYAAEEYLHKAREKESYAQYERAVDYGKLALAHATKALEKSQAAKAGSAPAALPTESPAMPAEPPAPPPVPPFEVPQMLEPPPAPQPPTP